MKDRRQSSLAETNVKVFTRNHNRLHFLSLRFLFINLDWMARPFHYNSYDIISPIVLFPTVFLSIT